MFAYGAEQAWRKKEKEKQKTHGNSQHVQGLPGVQKPRVFPCLRGPLSDTRVNHISKTSKRLKTQEAISARPGPGQALARIPKTMP